MTGYARMATRAEMRQRDAERVMEPDHAINHLTDLENFQRDYNRLHGFRMLELDAPSEDDLAERLETLVSDATSRGISLSRVADSVLKLAALSAARPELLDKLSKRPPPEPPKE